MQRFKIALNLILILLKQGLSYLENFYDYSIMFKVKYNTNYSQ